MYQFKKDEGYGICGSKNIYTSRVKIGNWNEDLIGQDILEMDRDKKNDFKTVTTTSFTPVDSRPSPPQFPGKIPTIEEMTMRFKVGTCKEVIYGDEISLRQQGNRFQTETRTKYADENGKYSSLDGTLREEKMGQFKNDLDMINNRVTEYKANAVIKDFTPSPMFKDKIEAPLPDCRRVRVKR